MGSSTNRSTCMYAFSEYVEIGLFQKTKPLIGLTECYHQGGAGEMPNLKELEHLHTIIGC